MIAMAFRMVLLWVFGSAIAGILALFCEEGMLALYCLVSFGLSGLAFLIVAFAQILVGNGNRRTL
jgi:hypothetical protein